MDRVRLGVLGIGNIAPLNVQGYLDHPLCDVVALCDPRLEVAQAMAKQWGVPKVYRDAAELFADPDIDAVEILTPTNLHAEHVIAAAKAGKHISCQKPLANSIDEARRMVAAADEAGVMLRVTECYLHYPPLEYAKELLNSGAIGNPIFLRLKTVVHTDSAFQAALQPEGYTWRFDKRSPGGHLFDDVVHKYAVANWMFDQPVTNVQAVVREGPFFFEAPTAAIFEYDTPGLLGMMEVSNAPEMFIRTKYYGADEFFEIQGDAGWIWVTRCTGEMLDLPPVIHYTKDGVTHEHPEVDGDWGHGFTRSSAHFVDSLLAGTQPDMSGPDAIAALQLAFAVYDASNKRAPVNPASIDTNASPPWWPPTQEKLLRDAKAAGMIPEDFEP
jgi:predicted dehydrogenase